MPNNSNKPDHHRHVLNLLALVPPGQVVSYGQLADLAGLPGRARLVGRILRTEDTSALPWHRVVAADGRISLPAGSDGWLEQRYRLQAEGVLLQGNRVAMEQHRWRPDLAVILMLMEH
ncbi:MGMT family protein [Oceanisphaera psychrotolerans]|uniref:Cysteine methyltransferase n=1 Tax=Oceanisphaera psychrotolerans TaxID=1414654 RepID=A0A1J4QI63_9GAMM|nr:MGMT family protein [Oceanisphaera psychrotolerans]OIN13116.1 cysteine methyltransferase [Oceanisphaera psychrotolerans]